MAAKRSFRATPTAPIPAHPRFTKTTRCALTTKQKVRECVYPAISARYNRPVQDNTKLGAGGLGLDDTMIRTDLYATVIIAVSGAGCQIRELSPDEMAQAQSAGDIADLVWNDLIAS
jgi:hypothetical protein